MTTARFGESCMRMQTKSYAPSGHYSAESIAISRYSLAMSASGSRAPHQEPRRGFGRPLFFEAHQPKQA
jgi:hypothetical protein